MKIIFLSLILSLNVLSEEARSHEEQGHVAQRARADVKDASKAIEEIRALLCNSDDLKAFVKDALVEYEQRTTHDLDKKIRMTKTFAPYFEALKKDPKATPPLPPGMLEEAKKGTEIIKQTYINWAIDLMTRIHQEAGGEKKEEEKTPEQLQWFALEKALAPDLKDGQRNIMARTSIIGEVVFQYDESLKRLDARIAGQNSTAFNGIECSACNAGYLPLYKGLRKNNIWTGKKPKGC